MKLRDGFTRYRAPGEQEAGARTWKVVAAAFEERPRERVGPARRGWRPLIAAAAGAAAIAVVITPAGAAVRDWIEDVVDGGRDAGPEPLRLPAGGRVLVDTEAGPWIVSAEGSQRFLGHYEEASWSPQGRFVVATRGRDVFALEPTGRVRWRLSAALPVRAARWAPSGYRIAYLSGSTLRVVAGDGTGDGRFARTRTAAAPAWRPGAEHVLAFAEASGRVTVANTDSANRLWRGPPGEPVRQLAWSRDASRLVALGDRSLRIFTRDGQLLRTLSLRGDLVAFGDDHRFALVRPQPAGGREVVVLDAERDPRAARRLFAGPGRVGGVDWSPDGRWLLIGWTAGDQWLFVPADGGRRVRAASRMAERFDPGEPRGPHVPGSFEWCCAG